MDFDHCGKDKGSLLPGHWIVEVVIGASAILGNGLVILIMLLGKVKRTTANIFITNLALVDLLTGVSVVLFKAIPNQPPASDNRIYMKFYCQLYCSEFPLWAIINVSVLNLSLITLERYLAVMRPVFHKNTFSKPRNYALGIVLIWITGIAASCYNSVAYEVFENEEYGLSCRIDQSLPSWFWVLVVCWTLFGMLLAPFIFMVAVYVKICLSLHRMPANTKGKMSQTRVTRSCIIILTVFLLCWLPDQTYFFFYAIEPWGIRPSLDSIGYHLVVNLGFANSAFNPFLYAFLNPSYKEAFIKIFRSRNARLERATTGIDTSISRSHTKDNDDNTTV